jgi:hypothetical protein
MDAISPCLQFETKDCATEMWLSRLKGWRRAAEIHWLSELRGKTPQFPLLARVPGERDTFISARKALS